jgi:shikimate kinase
MRFLQQERFRIFGSLMSGDASTPANIILIGFMGTGKSSVGRLLARQLDYRFTDTDQLVVQLAGKEIADIFATRGEAHFRELESNALRSLAEQERRVIATGGGIVVREENRALLRALGFVVWLTAREEVIFERVARNKKRPLLQTADPQGTIHRMLGERQALYAAAAQWTIDTSDLPHAEVAGAITAEARRVFSWQAAG